MHDHSIKVSNVTVIAVDTLRRAATLKQLLLHTRKLQSSKKTILHDINFEAKDGDKIGILGTNGSGKSSLLKVISGSYPPSSGTVEVFGKTIRNGSYVQHMMTGRDNIKYYFAIHRNIKSYNDDIANEIIQFSGLSESIDAPLYQYSSGMIARLLFSCFLFQNADILLLDEALATGDDAFNAKSYNSMINKVRSSKICIFVSHSVDDIKKVCTYCYIMTNGKIVDSGETESMIKSYQKTILCV